MKSDEEISDQWNTRERELLKELWRLDDKVESTPPTAQDMLDEGERWPADYNDVFGSWNEGLEAAGFEPRQQRKLTDEELLNGIRELNQRVKPTPPTKAQMDEYGEYWGRSYIDRFGSWNEAVEEAGYTPRQKPEDRKDRPDACPLCERVESGLDFHHWRYGDNKIGCYLCRECHDLIHQGKASPANSDWLVYAIGNLVEQHTSEHNNSPSIDEVVNRYNLPGVKDLVRMAIDGEGIYQ
jgi:uncharacterized protein YlaI